MTCQYCRAQNDNRRTPLQSVRTPDDGPSASADDGRRSTVGNGRDARAPADSVCGRNSSPNLRRSEVDPPPSTHIPGEPVRAHGSDPSAHLSDRAAAQATNPRARRDDSRQQTLDLQDKLES